MTSSFSSPSASWGLFSSAPASVSPKVKYSVKTNLGMAPDQLDVVVEHVKGGFHLNHGRQKARNLNVTEIVEDPAKEIQILTATLPFMSACFDFSSTFKWCAILILIVRDVDRKDLQSGASSRAKIGGAYFSDVTGSIQDPIAVPGPCEVTEC